MHDAKHAPQPLDILWQAPALVWVLLVGEGLAIVLTLAPGMAQERWVYFGLMSLAIQWIALLTLGCLYILRARLAGTTAQQLAYLALGLLLANTWLVTALVWLLTKGKGAAWDDEWVLLFARSTGIVLTVGLLGLAAFQNYWRARQSVVRAKQAELQALQARIDPHFLFNTLNTGISLARSRPEATERVLLDLADLFRAALSGARLVQLGEELELARRYLEIEQLRFGDRLRVSWSLPAEVPAILVPTLSVQPLVENAIRHGIEQIALGGEVGITVEQDAGMVSITIWNTLPGSDAGTNNGHNIGLNSARARVESMTGGRGGIVTRQKDGRYEAIVTLPEH